MTTTANVFSEIYQRNIWRGIPGQSRSGPGSGTAATQTVAKAIAELVDRHGFRSVLDFACGDGWWMPDLPGYVGVDVAPEAIEQARKLHPDRVYVVQDVRTLDTLRGFDLVIVRDVIQHVSLDDGLDILHVARCSAEYILASSYDIPQHERNTGCSVAQARRGWAYANDLTAAPFIMGEPIERIPDGWAYHERGGIRDPRKYLGLWAA